jgi:hypothetical protein
VHRIKIGVFVVEEQYKELAKKNIEGSIRGSELE